MIFAPPAKAGTPPTPAPGFAVEVMPTPARAPATIVALDPQAFASGFAPSRRSMSQRRPDGAFRRHRAVAARNRGAGLGRRRNTAPPDCTQAPTPMPCGLSSGWPGCLLRARCNYQQRDVATPMDENRDDPWEIRRQAEAQRTAALDDIAEIEEKLAERRAMRVGHRESTPAAYPSRPRRLPCNAVGHRIGFWRRSSSALSGPSARPRARLPSRQPARCRSRLSPASWGPLAEEIAADLAGLQKRDR